MLAIINSVSIFGMDAHEIKVEVDVSNGLPAFDIVGLPDTSVKEAKERVRTAIKNSGFDFPIKRITVNLAPANIRKEGSLFDLPVALGILVATGQLDEELLNNKYFTGELSLDGSLRPINGVLVMSMHIKHKNCYFFLPEQNAYEAALAGADFVFGVKSLKDLLDVLKGNHKILPCRVDTDALLSVTPAYGEDFADVKGQQLVKRALEIAVAGMHNILLIGTPGSGKTMLARRLQTILPQLSLDESLFLTKLYSIAGLLKHDEPLIHKRPFRAPHHTSSVQSMVGGGKFPKPGEISLATHGVLFMDELPEYQRSVMESLRQPLEDGTINIARLAGNCTFPARPLLIAAMNPCPCGYLGDSIKECSCTPHQIRRYIGKISGPILDRIDMHIYVPRVNYEHLIDDSVEENSSKIKERILAVRHIQRQRFIDSNYKVNAQMTKKDLRQHVKLSKSAQEMFKEAYNELYLSARAHDRILKVARTIADIQGADIVLEEHLAEALQYRNLDKIYQGI